MIKSASVPVLEKRSNTDNKSAIRNANEKQNMNHETPSSFIRDICFASVERDKHTAIKANDGLSNVLAERRRIELYRRQH